MAEEVVPKGYKKTEVGVIPEEWKVSSLGRISDLSSGTTPSRSLHSRYYQNGSIYWIKTLDLNNSLIFETDERVTELALKETSLQVYPVGTVVVAMYGGYNQIGRTGYLTIPAAVNQALTAIRPQQELLDSGYLLRTLNFRIQYWKAVASSSRKDPNITSNDVRGFSLCLPALNEQRAIATALSDIDALIAGLEQLIAKKRALKQAALQQLLTGQKRLPGFPGEFGKQGNKSVALNDSLGLTGYKKTEVGTIPEDWEIHKLGELGESLIGLTYRPEDVCEAGTLVLRSSNIQEAKLSFDDKVFVNTDIPQRIMVVADDILICVRNGSRNLIGKSAIIDSRANGMTFGAFMAVFRSPYGRFIQFLFQSEILKRQINEHLGATINQITNKSLNSFLVPIPRLESERIAIATVLSDMDSELTALEHRRDKTRLLKQGMMQQLLTGRIRLVDPVSATPTNGSPASYPAPNRPSRVPQASGSHSG